VSGEVTGRVTAHERAAKIQKLARTQAALTRVLRRYFTAEELGQIFDLLPDGQGEPFETLVTAVGTAWSEEAAAGRPDQAEAVTSDGVA
jgi:hypothetical protein